MTRFTIKPPFGDGVTVHEAAPGIGHSEDGTPFDMPAVLEIAEDGTLAEGRPVAYRQYLTGGAYYAENNIQVVRDGN